MKMPWNNGDVSHNFFMGSLAPEITTVSNPKIKPARAATIEYRKRLFFFISKHPDSCREAMEDKK
jgi:hypothetical protein